jgi:hypothetical protein
VSCYRVVQSYGRDIGREATTITEHRSIADAFAEIDRLADEMARKGARSDFVRLIVVDDNGEIVPRPGTF